MNVSMVDLPSVLIAVTTYMGPSRKPALNVAQQWSFEVAN